LDDNQTINSLGVIYDDSKKLWEVGIIGDENNEFQPTQDNNNYIAYIDFNFTVNNEGNISFNFITKYYFEFNGIKYNVEKPLPQCRELNATLTSSMPISGSFNVVNESYNNEDSIPSDDSGVNALHTQIVNKLFTLKLVKLKDDNVTVDSSFKGIVRLDLIRANNFDNLNESEKNSLLEDSISLWEDYLFVEIPKNGNKFIEFNMRYEKALKEGTFKISFIPVDFNNICNNITPQECWFNLIKDGKIPVKVLAKDSFAIRPYSFKVFGKNEYKKAGEEFNLIIKAVDEGNDSINSGVVDNIKGVEDYNVPLSDLNISESFYQPTDTELAQMQNDVGDLNVTYCPNKGTFTIVNSSNFVNGEVNAVLKYSETGILTLTVAEKVGSEFAICDRDDTPDDERLIKEAKQILDIDDINQTNILLFIPYKIEVDEGEFNTTTNTDWIYMGNDVINSQETNQTPKMASYIYYKIKALNKDGDITKNFTKTCFPDVNAPTKNGLKLNLTFDLFLDANLNASKDVNISCYVEDGVNNNAISIYEKNFSLNFNSVNSLQEVIYPKNFNNGAGEAKVYFNINKDYKTPIEEVNITVLDINTSTSWMSNPGATNIFIGKNINKMIKFRYGRIKVSNKTEYNNEINNTFEYQYWTQNGWEINKDHINSTFGDFNHTLNPDIHPYIVVDAVTLNNGKEYVKFIITHSLPYSEKIHLQIDEWLWYHPLAKDYKDPSKDNLDCLTHPCFTLDFLKEGIGWGGVSVNNNSKFNVTNRTIEINSSKNLDATKQEVKKLNW